LSLLETNYHHQQLGQPIGKKLENCDHSVVYSLYVLMVSSIEYVNQEKNHYEGLMTTKVLPAIKTAEAEYADLQQLRQVFVLLLTLMAFFTLLNYDCLCMVLL
jgi:hypothetical protein